MAVQQVVTFAGRMRAAGVAAMAQALRGGIEFIPLVGPVLHFGVDVVAAARAAWVRAVAFESSPGDGAAAPLPEPPPEFTPALVEAAIAEIPTYEAQAVVDSFLESPEGMKSTALLPPSQLAALRENLIQLPANLRMLPDSHRDGTAIERLVQHGRPRLFEEGQTTPDGIFTLVGFLGQGAFGEVWAARNAVDDVYAVKFCLDPAATETLRAEIGSIKHLYKQLTSRDGVVQFFSPNLNCSPPYVVTEYCSGGDLLHLMATRGALAPAEAAALLLPVARALAEAHALGMYHRDIKPANILVANDGRSAKLADFGLARIVVEQSMLSIVRTASSILRANAGGIGIAGTTFYMAPELRHGRVDPDTLDDAARRDALARADIFSFGATLAQVLAGSPTVQDGHLPRKLKASLPTSLIDLIDHSTEQDPADRLGDVAQFAKALAEAASSVGSSASAGAAPDIASPPHRASVSPEQVTPREVETVKTPAGPVSAVTSAIASTVGRVLGIPPDLMHALVGRQNVATTLKQFEEARSAFEQARERFQPTSGKYREAQAALEASAGRVEEELSRQVAEREKLLEDYLPTAPEVRGVEARMTPLVAALRSARGGFSDALRERLRGVISQEAGDRDELALGGGLMNLSLRWCPPGTFLMGSPGNEEGRSDNEGPQTHLTLTQGFWMGETPVTQKQWETFMGSNPSHFKGETLPVENVSWHDAMAFCEKVSKRFGREATLPTEAQWEYACRAGTTTRYAFGDNDAQLGAHAWFSGNSGSRTHPVGEKQPNPWGLFDMHGNVWEWTASWYEDKLPGGSMTDWLGSDSGSDRVIRGGSWCNVPEDCRSAFRDWCALVTRNFFLGFRVALPK